MRGWAGWVSPPHHQQGEPQAPPSGDSYVDKDLGLCSAKRCPYSSHQAHTTLYRNPLQRVLPHCTRRGGVGTTNVTLLGAADQLWSLGSDPHDDTSQKTNPTAQGIVQKTKKGDKSVKKQFKKISISGQGMKEH